MLSVSTVFAPGDSLPSFKRMLESVKFADHLQIYAMALKQDKTLALLADKYHAQVIHVDKPLVVEYIRERQVKEALGDWVLIMDMDEVVTPALEAEIQSIAKSPNPPPESAYAIPRRNFSLGYPLKHGGWGTDYVIRLFRKSAFLTWPKEIHSTPTFQGQLGTLNNYLEHHKDESLEYIVDKTNRYSDQEAAQFYAGSLPPVTSFTLLRKLKMEMIRRGLIRGGILDGRIGVIQSIYQGFSVFLSYAKLFELQQHKKFNLSGKKGKKQSSSLRQRSSPLSSPPKIR